MDGFFNTLFRIRCASCDKIGGAGSDPERALQKAKEYGYKKLDGKHYCEKCFQVAEFRSKNKPEESPNEHAE